MPTPKAKDLLENSTGVKDSELMSQKQLQAHKENLNYQNLGWLGKLFGSKENAPTNIAGAVILFCIIGLMALPVFHVEKEILLPMRETFGGALLATLGYLFGSKNSK